MGKLILVSILAIILAGCATPAYELPKITTTTLVAEFGNIPPPPLADRPISVAVYSFRDLTGQRRPQNNVASLSTAVTQGAESFLIKALQDVGDGKWFEVVERVGIDNLTKERLIIRQMREAYEGPEAKPLPPMQFAGIIIEGGIIGYDSSVNSGGVGVRIFGIGPHAQWSQDVVTISIRAISVSTGKVLTTIIVQKTILSSADAVSAFRFFDTATQVFEAETGLNINEPGVYAVKSAIESAVIELIKQGVRKGIWEYQTN